MKHDSRSGLAALLAASMSARTASAAAAAHTRHPAEVRGAATSGQRRYRSASS